MQLLHFIEGDNVWFSAWYYLEEPEEYITLVDLESTFVRGYPGMRIRLQQGYLELEMAKWVPNEIYRQVEDEEISFPTGRWVFVEAHLVLSEKDDGVIQLFQDHKLIISVRSSLAASHDQFHLLILGRWCFYGDCGNFSHPVRRGCVYRGDLIMQKFIVVKGFH